MKRVIFFLLISFFFSNNFTYADTAKSSLGNVNIQKLYPSFADIVEPLIPAVVNIQTEYKRSKSGPTKGFVGDQLLQEYLFDFLEQQFNLPFDLDDHLVNTASGSGFIIDQSGYVVTNHHVIVNADEIKVKLIDKTEFPAKLIGSDPKTDLALLKIEANKPLSFVKFGKSQDVRIGDWIIAIGNPFGLGGTVTTGIISSKERDIEIDSGNIIDSFLQTDASINKGNSGGPMFNLNGEVVGVNTAIMSPSGMCVGIGFSIPSDTAQHIIEQLKKHGSVVRGSLDIGIQEISNEIAEALGLPDTNGVLVIKVNPGGAADKSGLKTLDVITEFNGQQVKNARKLKILVAEAPVNQEIKVNVIRGGKKIELTCKTLNFDNSEKNKVVLNENNEPVKSGNFEKNETIFQDINAQLIKQYNLPANSQGVLVTKVSKNKNYNLKLYDIILEVNQSPILNLEQFKQSLEEAKKQDKKAVILLVRRRNINIYTVFPIS